MIIQLEPVRPSVSSCPAANSAPTLLQATPRFGPGFGEVGQSPPGKEAPHHGEGWTSWQLAGGATSFSSKKTAVSLLLRLRRNHKSSYSEDPCLFPHTLTDSNNRSNNHKVSADNRTLCGGRWKRAQWPACRHYAESQCSRTIHLQQQTSPPPVPTPVAHLPTACPHRTVVWPGPTGNAPGTLSSSLASAAAVAGREAVMEDCCGQQHGAPRKPNQRPLQICREEAKLSH